MLTARNSSGRRLNNNRNIVGLLKLSTLNVVCLQHRHRSRFSCSYFEKNQNLLQPPDKWTKKKLTLCANKIAPQVQEFRVRSLRKIVRRRFCECTHQALQPNKISRCGKSENSLQHHVGFCRESELLWHGSVWGADRFLASDVMKPARRCPLMPVMRLPKVETGARCHAIQDYFVGSSVRSFNCDLPRSIPGLAQCF